MPTPLPIFDTTAWFAAVLIALAFVGGVVQVVLGARVGTDNAVHWFLVRAIRKNGNRFFTRIPGLLNRPACGAMPLYLHWILARFPDRVFQFAPWTLNPAVNLIHLLIFAGLASATARLLAYEVEWVLMMTAVFALTPQNFHALSARNFGISSRGMGLLFLTLFYSAFIYVQLAATAVWAGWLAMGLAAYLIFAFNTFAIQSLLILSAILSVLFWHWIQWLGIAGGLAIFVAIHPRYSLSYLVATWRFVVAYARELAPIYILNRRYSIWRDLIFDIWLRIARAPQQGLRYAYENSILVSFLLNPLVLVAVAYRFSNSYAAGSLMGLICALALSGAIAMLATSLRATRFLGEPERYVEAVTPWSTLLGGVMVFTHAGWWGIVGVAVAFLVVDLLQVFGSFWLIRHLRAKPVDIDAVEQAIERTGLSDIRLCSSDEQLTKALMRNDWQFSYCIAVGEPYCGMTVAEAFAPVPHLTPHALRRIVESYRINICVLAGSSSADLGVGPPAGAMGQEVIYQSEAVAVLAIDWPEEARPLAGERCRS